MTTQQIFEGMTKGEWEAVDNDHIKIGKVHLGDFMDSNVSIKEDEFNTLAATTAVNATYGKGLDPEKMEEMYKHLSILHNHLEVLTNNPIHEKFMKEISDCLTSCKLK